jgi:hypothetical protein
MAMPNHPTARGSNLVVNPARTRSHPHQKRKTYLSLFACSAILAHLGRYFSHREPIFDLLEWPAGIHGTMVS